MSCPLQRKQGGRNPGQGLSLAGLPSKHLGISLNLGAWGAMSLRSGWWETTGGTHGRSRKQAESLGAGDPQEGAVGPSVRNTRSFCGKVHSRQVP